MALTIGTAVLSATSLGGLAVGAGTLATSSILGISTASIVGTVAIGGALVGAEAILEATAATQKQTFTVQQALAPRVRIYGRTMVGGVRAFLQVRNGNLYQDIMLASHEIDAIEGFYIGGAGVAVVNNLVQSAPWGRSGGASYIGYDPHLGAEGMTVSGLIPTTFPEVGTYWLAGIAHVGIVMLGVKASDFPKIYPQAQDTQFRFVVRGAKIFDPRDQSFAFKNNSGLVALDYLTHPDGMNLPQSRCDLSSFADMANLCDEAVALKGGNTEARYNCNGTYTFDEAPKDVLKRILATCDGQTVQGSGGLIGLRGGQWRAPTVSIGSKHVLGLQADGGAGALASYTRLTVSFSYGLQYYAMTELPPRIDAASEAVTGSLPQSLALPMVTSYSQAARLGKIRMLRDNPAWIVKARVDAMGLDAIGEETIDLAFQPIAAAAPLFDASFAVTGLTIDLAKGSAELAASSLDATVFAWDPATEEPDPPAGAVQITDPNYIAPPADVQAMIAQQTMSDGSKAYIGTLTWDASPRLDVTAVAQFSLSGQQAWQAMTVAASNLSATTPGLQHGQFYDFEVAWVTTTATSAESVVVAIQA